MKLLLCFQCQDVVKLQSSFRTCKCGRTSGKYIDDVNAEYTGAGCLIGISNPSLASALTNRHSYPNAELTAFLIPDTAKSVRRK